MLSADQTPPAPPDGPEPPPGGTPRRLFFPDEPAVPPSSQVPRQQSAGQEPPGQSALGQPGPVPPPSAQLPFGQQPPVQAAPPHEPAPHEPAPHEPAPHEPAPHEPGPHEPGLRQPARQGPGGPGGPAGRPQRPGRAGRPTAAPRRELQQRALAAAVFGLLSLFSLSAANLVGHPLYLVIFAVAVALLAIVTGASAARRARKEATARPRGSVAAIVLGAISLVLAAFLSVAIVFANEITAYQNCVAVAPNTAAQQACAQKLMNAVDHKLGGQ